MARPGQRVSKRAQHKLDVEARKDQPFVKRVKVGRRKALPFPTEWFAMARELEREGVLLTRIGRKPPRYRMELPLDNGTVKAAMLIKAPKGNKGYHVVLDDAGNGYAAPTKRKAIKAFTELQSAEVAEDGAILSKDGTPYPEDVITPIEEEMYDRRNEEDL